MGSFIRCMKIEYNLDNGIMSDDEDIEEQEVKDKELEQFSSLKDFEKRTQSVADFHLNSNLKYLNHYNENFLNLKNDVRRKKSNTIFIKPKLQDNL